MLEPGLYVVATPIGNLADLSPRAESVLRDVDLIAAEDTRYSRRLLTHFGIGTPMVSLHDHNEQHRARRIVEALPVDQSLALISDAGTPLVSDPGYRVVQAAHAMNRRVFSVPGPCSAVAALSIAGLPCDRFAFEGFLPAKAASRLARLESLVDSPYSLIFFVPPRLVLDTLAQMESVFGAKRQVALARELTKRFEQVRVGRIGELVLTIEKPPRGEFVIVVAPVERGTESERSPGALDPKLERLLVALLHELPLKRAVDLVAEFSSEKRNRIYRRALDIANHS